MGIGIFAVWPLAKKFGKGACCEWVFRVMCGIQVSGENRFTIAPRPGAHFTCAGLSYNSIYGTVGSSWERRNGKTVYTITIPANCTAELSLSGGLKQELTAWLHTFEEETA